MSDFEKYKQLFTETGVTFKVNDTDNHTPVALEMFDYITVEIDSSPPDGVVEGYYGFRTDLVFNKSGKLKTFGIWE